MVIICKNLYDDNIILSDAKSTQKDCEATLRSLVEEPSPLCTTARTSATTTFRVAKPEFYRH